MQQLVGPATVLGAALVALRCGYQARILLALLMPLLLHHHPLSLPPGVAAVVYSAACFAAAVLKFLQQ